MSDTSFAEAAQDVDQWENWRRLLDLAAQHKVKKAFHEAMFAAGLSAEINEPFSGYWRLRPRDGGSPLAVGIWRDDDGTLVVLLDGKNAEVKRVWPFSVLSPVPYEWYVDNLNGKGWPDVDEAVAMLAGDEFVPEEWRGLDEGLAPRGHNAPPKPDLTTLAGIKEAIALIKPRIAAYAKITSDEMRDKAQSLRSEFMDLASKADKMREALVRPHVDQQRTINGEWNPVVNDAKAQAGAIKQAQDAWADAKLKAKREEEAAAAAAQRAAEEAARAANAPPPPAPPPKTTAPAPAAFRGGTGRVSKEVAEEVIPDDGVTDWAALFTHYQENAEVRALLLKLARRDLKADGTVPPGVRTETKGRVK